MRSARSLRDAGMTTWCYNVLRRRSSNGRSCLAASPGWRACFDATHITVIPGFMPGTHSSACVGVWGAMGPGNKCRDDSGGCRLDYGRTLQVANTTARISTCHESELERLNAYRQSSFVSRRAVTRSAPRALATNGMSAVLPHSVIRARARKGVVSPTTPFLFVGDASP